MFKICQACANEQKNMIYLDFKLIFMVVLCLQIIKSSIYDAGSLLNSAAERSVLTFLERALLCQGKSGLFFLMFVLCFIMSARRLPTILFVCIFNILVKNCSVTEISVLGDIALGL